MAQLWVIIAVVAAVIAGVAYVIYKVVSDTLTIEVSIQRITIPAGGTATFTAIMWNDRWFRPKRRRRGTVTATIPQLGRTYASVAPAAADTTHSTPATFTVTGITAGETDLYVNGTSRQNQRHNTETIRVIVTAAH